MRLRWLEAEQFRSYADLRFEPDPAVNILIGENGAGKSNLIEAVSYLARLRSFRRAPDDALIAIGAAGAVVRGEFTNGGSTALVEAELPRSGRRRILLNGKRPRRHADVSMLIPTITFLPDDLALVKGGPSYRREYLDEVAALLSPVAAGEQEEYARLLRQRNSVLRQQGRQADEEALEVWEAGLARTGAAILRRRLGTARRLIPVLDAVYREIGPGGKEVRWRYTNAGLGELAGLKAPDDADALLMARLRAARHLDMDRRVTTVGPHRDEASLLLEGSDARTLASQGEQRTLAVGLRLASFDHVLEQTGERPMLLLDDVFSELDSKRASGVVRRLPHTQVFVTTAQEDSVPVEGRTWHVGTGGVR